MENCIICKSKLIKYSRISVNQNYYNCERCGEFVLPHLFEVTMDKNTDDWRWILSHWIRRKFDGERRVKLSVEQIEEILKNELPKPIRQAEYLIEFIGNELKYPAERIVGDTNKLAAIIGAKGTNGVDYIGEHLKNNDIILYELLDQGNPSRRLGLTFLGWRKFDKIKKGSIESNIAFMAMEYDDKILDNIYKKKIKDAVERVGFEIRRLDEIPRAGLIDNHLRDEIRRSKFLLADLTFDNNGAYWEAGYAEGLGKPVIYLCHKPHFDKFKTHFDTNHHTTIIWEEERIDDAMDNLIATIRNTFSI